MTPVIPTTPTPVPVTTSTFNNLGIAPRLLEALEKAKYTSPTPIQEKSIPIAIEGKDVIGIAQTGTGKTLAFGIPMLQRLAAVKGRGLILVPTRELALQVEESLMKVGRLIQLRTAVLIGGAAMSRQVQMIRNNPHVIVATPGRLIDHMEQKTINLTDVKVLVLDEADRMLDMGFMPQIQKVLTAVPKERQTLLFSATMPAEIVAIANRHMALPVRVEIARAGTSAEKVAQEMFVVGKHDKGRLLEKLLGEYKGSILVFTRTKFGAKRVARDIRAMGHNSAEIHSNRSLAQRREALEGFRSGKYRVLVATDIAARGIDVKGIEVVINFDLPDAAEDYVHRIGRTGRAGMEGRAISFATPDQGRDIRIIESVIRKQIPMKKLPTDLPPARVSERISDDEMRSEGRSGRGGRSSGGYGGSRGGYGASPRPAYGSPRSPAPYPMAPRAPMAARPVTPRAPSPRFNPVMNTYERPAPTGMQSIAGNYSSPARTARPAVGGAEVPTMGGVPVRARTPSAGYAGRSGAGASRGFGARGGSAGKPPRRGKSNWIPKKTDEDRPAFKPKKGPKKFFGNPFGGPVQF